ncbi:hypothetical protein ACFL2C_00335 [Patescibacteria group bacterium]
MKRTLSFIVVVFVAVLVVVLLKKFQISKFECNTQFSECDQELVNQLNGSLPQDYFSARESLQDVMKNNTHIYKYSYQLRLPATIRVDILVRKPTIALKSENVNSVSLVDQFGKVVRVESTSNLPFLYIEGKLPNVGEDVGQFRMNQILMTLGFYSSFEIEKVIEENEDLYIHIFNTPLVIVPSTSDNELMVGSVNLVLSRLKHILQESKIDISEVQRIDFRYKDPIIVKV